MSDGWNFARRPFRDERPVLLAIGSMAALGLLFFGANLQLFLGFSRHVEGTRKEIARLELRRDTASRASDQSRRAVEGFRLSTLAEEAAGLQTIVRERRFSWLALLGRLEKTLPTDVRLSRLQPRFDSADSISLDMSMLGRNPESIVKTIAALSKDKAFRDVQLQTESSPEAGVPEGYTFTVRTRYLPEEGR